MCVLENESMYKGRYRILRELDEGGSSRVYMAVDLKSEQPVTVKVFKAGDVCGKEVEDLSFDEAKILKMLDHPNIPKLIDVHSDCVVMEYVPGNSLEKYIKRGIGIKEKEAVRIAMELLDILKYLHGMKNPVIYRDLKPANIIIKPDGSASLIDFGAARLYIKGEAADTSNIGTYGFAAPEQYGNLGQTDPRTDIYCFGKTLLMMVSDKCSPELMAVIDKCTRPDREDRYRSCREIEKALREYPKKRAMRKTLGNIRIALLSAAAALVISFGIGHYESVVSYAAVDAKQRIPAVKERLGNAGIRIKEILKEKEIWPAIEHNGGILK